MSNFLSRLGATVLLLWCCSASSQEIGSEISTADPSIREAIVAPLVGCHPSGKTKVEHHVSKDGEYALYGDLFGDGRFFAFSQFDKGAGFSEWKDDHWEPEQAWNIPVEWDAPGSFDDYLGREKPAKEAFAIIPSGRGRHLVSIAGEDGKYHQEFYVVEYNALKHAPEIVGVTMKRPYQQAGYWVFYTCSPRLAEWEEWNFFRVHAGQMSHVAKWYEFVSVNNPDNQSCTADVFDHHGQLVQEAEIQDVESESAGTSYRISTSKADASLKFNWLNGNEVDPDQAEMELAYLFGKLTRLPTAAFPHEDAKRYSRKLTNLSSVQVTGDADLAKQLLMSAHKNSR